MPFELPKLPYDYNALEPYIDLTTMEIHHTKHHAGYTKNLNSALEKYPELYEKSISDILQEIDNIPEDIRQAVINNGGGYYNHNLYWENMTPELNTKPTGDFEKVFVNTFESLKNFELEFSKAATTRFGSGWAWLVMDENKNLSIVSTPNQNNPISDGLKPLLAIDVWEHAYYLNYQNRRPDYIENWLKIINWDVVSARYNQS